MDLKGGKKPKSDTRKNKIDCIKILCTMIYSAVQSMLPAMWNGLDFFWCSQILLFCDKEIKYSPLQNYKCSLAIFDVISHFQKMHFNLNRRIWNIYHWCEWDGQCWLASKKKSVDESCHVHRVQLGGGGCRKAQRWFPPSCPHTCSLNLKELVLQLLVSQLSMVRSVKVTLPSASIRIIVLVLKGQGHSGYKQTLHKMYN